MKAVVFLGGIIVALPVILHWMEVILRLIEMLGRFWRLLARIASWIFGGGKASRSQEKRPTENQWTATSPSHPPGQPSVDRQLESDVRTPVPTTEVRVTRTAEKGADDGSRRNLSDIILITVASATGAAVIDFIKSL